MIPGGKSQLSDVALQEELQELKHLIQILTKEGNLP